MKTVTLCGAALTACFLATLPGAPRAQPPQRPHGLAARTPWTTSRLTGSPDPPHPYRIERAFPKLTFKNPLLLTTAPGTGRFFVGEQGGKIYSFRDDQGCAKADLFLDVNELKTWDPEKVRGLDALYGLAFHPRFADNRSCYVCYVLNGKRDGGPLPDGSRVARFTVTNTDPPRCDPKSEKVLLTWRAGGHNGGDLHFGNDGFLYVSTGDGANPNPPDALDTGQDLSDLLGSILRIDVDRADRGKAYAVPPGNPFLKTPKARPEIWAYGFRNPWRMSFDRPTGDLWVGDVGWERWEMIYRVQRGGNYGWSVMEGPQPVRPESRRGPTPILPPTLAFPHTEAASITGGFVYRGQRLKELTGAYICGDWVTRKLWATRFDGDRIVWHKELAQGAQRIVAFGQDDKNELYFVNYDDIGTLHRLIPNPAAKEKQPDFPRRLSATGLFTKVLGQAPAPGVVPFSVNAAPWADGATAERFVALPGKSVVRLYDSPVAIPGGFYSGQVFFPKHGVVAKTISLEMERGNPASRRRLETQVLHFDGEAWRGYTYQWDDAQTDATLVPAAGLDRAFTVTDRTAPGGKRRQTWHFPSRTECLTCHNPWAGYTLAFTLAQLNRDHDYGGTVDNQLRALRHVGMIDLLHHDEDTRRDTTLRDVPAVKLTDPYDTAADLGLRARSYLHVNCAHCHQFGAGGTADIELRHTAALDRMKLLEVRPVQGAFGIAGALLLAPGDPYRSVLYYRMAKLGPGRMPHIGSEVIDERGLRLMHDWIRQLPMHRDERLLLERLRDLDERAALAREKADAPQELARLAREAARAHGGKAVTAADRKEAAARLRARAAVRAKARAGERASAIGALLSTTTGALLLMEAVGAGRIPASVRSQVLAAVAATAGQVRDLFERFLPDEQRVKRLGSAIRPEQILALKGDAGRGKELFFKSAGLQCASCHRVAGVGSVVGPDLTDLGKKSTRAQILESLLEPSKNIDPKYATYVVETDAGLLLTGVLASKNEREVVLRMAGDREVRVPAGSVVRLVPQRVSLMPDQLLRDLTAEQAVDLLEFLASLK